MIGPDFTHHVLRFARDVIALGALTFLRWKDRLDATPFILLFLASLGWKAVEILAAARIVHLRGMLKKGKR